MLNHGRSRAFQEYADTVIMPYVSNKLKKTTQINLMSDIYFPDSLKDSTRKRRGNGTRKKVSCNSNTRELENVSL